MKILKKHGDHCNCNACQHKREDTRKTIEQGLEDNTIASMSQGSVSAPMSTRMDEKQFEILIGKLNEMLEHLSDVSQFLYNIDQRNMKASFD